jgi:hypothetical protein
MTDPGYRARIETGNAIRRLVLAAGAAFVTRPLVRSDPGGSSASVPEPLAGITAAAAVEREARRQCLESVRYAREDGLAWQQAGEALGYRDGEDGTAAERAWRYAVPSHDRGDWFTWRCPSCGSLVRDHGPGLDPHSAEEGHADGCARFAGTVRAHEARGEDGDD